MDRREKERRRTEFLPVDTVTLSCGWWTIIEDMAKMSITNSTNNFLARHEYNRQV